MPVLESTDDSIAPKSILRHRPIGDGTSGETKGVETTPAPMKPRASRAHTGEPGEDVAEWKRLSPTAKTTSKLSASRRVRSTATKDTPAPTRTKTTDPSLLVTKPPRALLKLRKPLRIPKAHPLFYLGLGMIVMLLLWVMVSALVSWAHTTLDDLHYGYPRTFQTDAWVGHNEQTGMPSHFMAVNLRGHIEIIELEGGDPMHTRIYNGPQISGANSDLIPVTLRFADVTGDHRPDMIVTFSNTEVVFLNSGAWFVP